MPELTLTCVVLPPFILGVVGIFVSTALTLPTPYDGLRALVIPPERLGNITAFPADFEHGPVLLNDALRGAVRLFDGEVQGSEGVAVSHDGARLFMLDRFGYLHIATAGAGGSWKAAALRKKVAYIGPGRPLGFHLTEDGRLLVCDSLKGLLEVGPEEDGWPVRVLANTAPDGTPINYANDVDVSPTTGKVYFTSSTERPVALNDEGFYDTMRGFLYNALRGDASGRVFSYDPSTRKVELLMDGLWFPNGVAVAADGSAVFIVETLQYRVLRKCLLTGAVEVVIDRLPAHPDGLSRGEKPSTLWLSMVAPVSPLSFVFDHPHIRLALAYFTKVLKRLAKPQGLVAEVAYDGRVLRSLGDAKGEVVSSISSTTQHGPRLFFGNLNGDFVSYFDL